MQGRRSNPYSKRAVYDIKYATNYVYLKEQHLYGGERLGMVQLNKTVYANGTALPTDNYSTNTLGNKRYELVNHLGNVNAVITDRKMLSSSYSALSYYFDFTSTGNTGWTTSGCSGITVALASGKLRFTPASSCAFDVYKIFPVTTLKPYTVSLDLDRTDIANMDVRISAGTSYPGTTITTFTNPANGTLSYTFTPTASQPNVYVVFKKISTENKTFYIDNLQLQTAVSSPYTAVVVMTSDYYPFGMQMPGRHTNDPNYRYGYNGMEKDKEMHGEGNSYTTEFRQYDPRLGRWLSLDPLAGKYPNMSPYVAFNDNPIFFTDPLGLEGGKGRRTERRAERAARREYRKRLEATRSGDEYDVGEVEVKATKAQKQIAADKKKNAPSINTIAAAIAINRTIKNLRNFGLAVDRAVYGDVKWLDQPGVSNKTSTVGVEFNGCEVTELITVMMIGIIFLAGMLKWRLCR